MSEVVYPACVPELTDEHALLRPHRPSDADRMVEQCSDPDSLRWTTVPRPYGPGDAHEFWLRVTLAPGQPIWPYYAIVPLDPCESGTVRVRFGSRRPAEVWLLDEVPYTDLRNRPEGRNPVDPSTLGEVVRDFHNLREGHGYGLAWTPLSVS